MVYMQGGLTDLWLDDPYVVAASKLIKMAEAENAAGNVFPVCPGYSLLMSQPISFKSPPLFMLNVLILPFPHCCLLLLASLNTSCRWLGEGRKIARTEMDCDAGMGNLPRPPAAADSGG